MTLESTSATLLDKNSVCEKLNVRPRTLEAMVSRQEFPPSVRLGKKKYWHADVVSSWLERTFQVQRDWLP